MEERNPGLIRITYQTFILPLNMEERSPSDVGDRRSDLLTRVDDIYPESVHSVSAYVIPGKDNDGGIQWSLFYTQNSQMQCSLHKETVKYSEAVKPA